MELLPQSRYIHTDSSRAILHIFVSATTTLLSHVIANPSSPSSRSDLRLIEPLLSLFKTLAKSGKNADTNEIDRTFADMFKTASIVVENANRSRPQQETIDSKGKESVEEFLRRIETISAGYGDDLSFGRDLSEPAEMVVDERYFQTC